MSKLPRLRLAAATFCIATTLPLAAQTGANALTPLQASTHWPTPRHNKPTHAADPLTRSSLF